MNMTARDIWKLYENGVEHHNKINLYNLTEQAHRFFEGDQWYNTAGGENLPVINIIQPTVEYKTAIVAQNRVNITYTPLNNDENRLLYAKVCERLAEHTLKRWELAKMDDLCWEVVRNACIAGDSYLYFYNGEGNAQIIDNINIYLGDEQQRDIQRQPYIIIYERQPVEYIKLKAKENGISNRLIEEIKADEDTARSLGDHAKAEVKGEGKCVSLLYMYKDEQGYVHTVRSTKEVIYSPDSLIAATNSSKKIVNGLKSYPVASFVWQPKYGSARGIGEVNPIVANQTEINKGYARRAASVKEHAYPKLVYDRSKVEDPESLATVGATVAVDNLAANPVSSIVSYLSPAPISGAAQSLCEELINYTRTLSGAGDAALGQINPEKASGTAILAVADQTQLPLNAQISAFRAFVEEIAAIWFALWCVYNPEGVVINAGQGDMQYDLSIDPILLSAMRVDIKTDVSSATPFSKYAQQQAIDNLFASGAISFEEYVSLLDQTSVLPKSRLEELISARKTLM